MIIWLIIGIIFLILHFVIGSFFAMMLFMLANDNGHNDNCFNKMALTRLRQDKEIWRACNIIIFLWLPGLILMGTVNLFQYLYNSIKKMIRRTAST